MKKLKYIFLGVILGAVAAAGALLALYYSTKGDVDWRAYIEDVLLPNAVTALASIGVIGVGVSPAIKKMTEAISGFFSATEKVNATAEHSEKSDARIEESRREFLEGLTEVKDILTEGLERMDSRLSLLEGEVSTEFKAVEDEISGTCDILKLGFGNMDELVKKGKATKIIETEVKANVGKPEKEE